MCCVLLLVVCVVHGGVLCVGVVVCFWWGVLMCCWCGGVVALFGYAGVLYVVGCFHCGGLCGLCLCREFCCFLILGHGVFKGCDHVGGRLFIVKRGRPAAGSALLACLVVTAGAGV